MAKKIEEQIEEVKAGLKAYAEFEFRGKAYKVGDAFVVPADLVPDANMEQFRRVSNKKATSPLGKVFYYEIPSNDPEKENEVRQVILPVQ